MIKKKSLKFIAGALFFLALIMPRPAHAATVADLQETIDRAFKLCAVDSKIYANSCARAADLNTVKEAAAKKPASQQEAYIKKELPNYTDIRNGINKSYLIAINDGNISKSGEVVSGAGSTFSGDCNNGGVKISVGINKANDCVGGDGVNPIYAYLKNIIKFIGGAIGLAVVISIIVAGIQYSSSAGNPANITKAKERLTNAVIGLVLYLFLAAILRYLVPQIFL